MRNRDSLFAGIKMAEEMEEEEMSGKEEKKREKERIEEKREQEAKQHNEAAMPEENAIQGMPAEQVPGQSGIYNQMPGQMPGGSGRPDQMGQMSGVPNQMWQRPGTPNQMPGQQPGPQGGYGYQNPYRNNWQNQNYYGNDYNRRNANGYNNYPNQNYYYGSQGNAGPSSNGTAPGGYGYPGSIGSGGSTEPKKSGAKKKGLIALCIVLVIGIFGGSIYGINYALNRSAEAGEAEQTAAQPANPQIGEVDLEEGGNSAEESGKNPLQANLTDVSELVERIMPSVVSVNAVYSYNSYWGKEKYDGGGSGFIIGENETELLIATNSHVVFDAEDLEVTFVDEETVDAMVKGYDNDLDVAVIAVRLTDISAETKKNIAVAKLGESTDLKAGQAVISIGNALLLGQSVTTGIISAVNMPIGGGYDEAGNQYGSDDRVMIQTTAFMNPGCSGGVLINVSGEVIGINTMTINSYDVEGMCYAIPISDAIPVLDKLKAKQIRERLREEDSGYLGISCTNVEGKQAEDYDIPKGVYVKEVYEDGPAEKAGLQKGDVIVALNEEQVKTMDELSEMLRYYPVDEIVDLEVMRYESGEYVSRTVSVKLGRR